MHEMADNDVGHRQQDDPLAADHDWPRNVAHHDLIEAIGSTLKALAAAMMPPRMSMPTTAIRTPTAIVALGPSVNHSATAGPNHTARPKPPPNAVSFCDGV